MKYTPKLKNSYPSQKCNVLFRVLLLALIMFVLHLCLKPRPIELDISIEKQEDEQVVTSSIVESGETSDDAAVVEQDFAKEDFEGENMPEEDYDYEPSTEIVDL